MIGSGLYGVGLTILSFIADVRFRQVFRDFKITLPWPTELALFVSRIVWGDFGWLLLLPILSAWPLVLLPLIPPPQQPESRRALARTARPLFLMMIFVTVGFVAIALFAPMIALIQSVSGPAKK